MECNVDTVRVEFEQGPTVDGREIVGPFLTNGEVVVARWTVPLKPLVPVMIMV